MSIFHFSEQDNPTNSAYPTCIGSVQSVDNGKVFVQIASSECLTSLRIGSLVAIRGGVGRFIIAMVTRLWRRQGSEAFLSQDVEAEEEFDELEWTPIPENNGGLLTLLGALREAGGQSKFTRSMDELPAIDEEVFRISDQNLHRFMNVVSSTSKAAQDSPLHLGHFALDRTAPAFVDGNRLFQRHAALLGSTGSGKSWTVARILEQTANLENSCVILFDLHGEYGSLPYATRYRIAGPADLGSVENNVLFLPHWLLTYDEMQALFVDGSEHSAQNQTLMIHSAVTRLKRERLDQERRNEVLDQFTVDSPVPFSINDVIGQLRERNEETVPGSRGDKNGPYHGQFTRLIARLEAKRNDRRYGFMYQAPTDWQNYEALHRLADQLLCFGNGQSGEHRGIKVIDLSEVPSDVLPVVVGTLARLVFTLQFWTPAEWRHPVLLACDEAHLYLPKPLNANPLERSAVESVERIAKEGRKYGVGLMVISQRPSDVSETILSQCNNVIALRLTNPADQQTVRKLLPDNLGPLMQMLPLMEVGEAVVVGDAVLLPTRIKVEAPSAKPSSHTVEFWDRWGTSALQVDNRFAIVAENLRRQERLLSI